MPQSFHESRDGSGSISTVASISVLCVWVVGARPLFNLSRAADHPVV